jgi:hypothetical protein
MRNLSLVVLALVPLAQAGEFYVSPKGDDATGNGSAAKPFATIEKARDAARAEKAPSGSTLVLAPGAHRRVKTLELDVRDTGLRITGKGASLAGSVAVPNGAVKVVSDSAILERLLPEVRGKVLEIDLRALVVNDFGDIGPRGFSRPYTVAPLELIVDDRALDIARWPNAGLPGEPMGKVLDKGSVPRYGDKSNRGGTFAFNTDRPARWTQSEDVWITGLFLNGYADNTVKVKSFDIAKKTLTTVHPHMYGFGSGKPWNRWTALNLLEEIDLPGEFVADKKSGKAYFLPPAGFDAAKSRVEVTVLSEPLVALEGAKGVVFDGVDFVNARGMGVYIERGENCRIQNATMRNLGSVAVSIGKGVIAARGFEYRNEVEGRPASRLIGSLYPYSYSHTAFDREAGTGHGVVNCSIYNIGSGAISLGGGDRLSLTPAGNFVENCDIHDFNRWDRTYKGAVNIDGVGNRITHCDIHDAPAVAILLHGNDHIIEQNRIHRVLLEADEMGAFYMGRDPSERGTVLRHNFFHDIGQWDNPVASGHGTVALHFDDCAGNGTLVFGNIFRRAGSNSVFILGTEVTVKNNLILDCYYLQNPYNRAEYVKDGGKGGIFRKRLEAVKFDQSQWKERYPGFDKFLERIAIDPRENLVANNLIVTKGVMPPSKGKANPLLKLENNRFEKTVPDIFVDPARDNYALKPGADIGIPGFEPIPVGKIAGLDGKRVGKPE